MSSAGPSQTFDPTSAMFVFECKAHGRRVNGVERTLSELQVVAYDIPCRTIAGYYPECNGLIPLWHYAEGSKVSAAKPFPVRIFKYATPEIIEGDKVPISA